MVESLTVDELVFEVRRSARRTTLQLTVDREGELLIAAPVGTAETELTRFVREKKFWLYTKLAEKQEREQPRGGREFVNGEGFPYLGRSYRLKLVDAQDVPLKLVAGRFCLRRDCVDLGREVFAFWYTRHARTWIERHLTPWTTRMGVTVTALEVRDLGFRWGSCTPQGKVLFNWKTILLPRPAVDYVMVHELAHLVVRNHSPEFWKIVERTLPDYNERRTWLAENGGRYLL